MATLVKCDAFLAFRRGLGKHGKASNRTKTIRAAAGQSSSGDDSWQSQGPLDELLGAWSVTDTVNYLEQLFQEGHAKVGGGLIP